MRKINILHISTFDSGGAGIAASRLMEAMNQCENIEAKMLVLRRLSDRGNVYSIGDTRGVCFKLFNIVRQKIFNRILFFLLRPSFPFSHALSHVSHIERISMVADADVIYIHWVQSCFLNINDIGKLSELGKPVFLFLHDMWSFTGGCHYSMACDKWINGCEKCQMISRKCMQWISNYAIKKKMNSWNPNIIHIVSPSHWLEECSKRSFLFNSFFTVTIPNTLNDRTFTVMDKNRCRSVFNLPIDKKLIMFGAFEGTRSIFKGWEYVDVLMKRIRDDAELVVFGSSIENNFDYIVHPVGRIFDEHSMAILYNAVDVYISPTKAEAFGQTIVEAISCGTKVVAFNVGGVPDIINHMDNGYLAERDNVDDLERGVKWVLNLHDNDEERLRLHEDMKSHFSYSVVAKQHVDVINNILFHE